MVAWESHCIHVHVPLLQVSYNMQVITLSVAVRGVRLNLLHHLMRKVQHFWNNRGRWIAPNKTLVMIINESFQVPCNRYRYNSCRADLNNIQKNKKTLPFGIITRSNHEWQVNSKRPRLSSYKLKSVVCKGINRCIII